ncbi:MAG: antibiotic efflux protein, partial [Ilumatobacteraceae bacterium]|nr:antibiotic efflux protein [Ilumatobacteraceae bacterium]
LFAKERLHITDREFGFLLAVIGIGSIIGGLVGDRIVSHVGRLPALYGSVTVWAIALVAFGAFPVTWFVTLVSAIEALAATVWNVVTVSLRQQVVPDHLFGRVNSVYRWFGWGTIPLGAAFGGQVAAHLGLRAPYFVGAGVVLLALVVVVRTVTPGAMADAYAGSATDSDDIGQDTPRTPAPPSIT